MSATPGSARGGWWSWLTQTRRVPVLVLVPLVVLAWLEFWDGFDRFLEAQFGGDPATVFVGDSADGREIDPKAAIARQCGHAIFSVGSLDKSGDSWLNYHGSEYQSWRVVPKPGHVDRALLNGETGQVICP
jgi:hypothetical protein